VYVDDLIVTDARVEDIDSFKREMVAHFRMSDLGVLSYYLSIEVRQGKEALMLGQSAYASKLLERSGMTECKPCVQGRVRGGGQRGVLNCMAAPTVGRADRCGSSPTSTDV